MRYKILRYAHREDETKQLGLIGPVSESYELWLWLAGYGKKPVYAINVTVKEVLHDPLRTEPLRAPSGVGGSAPRRPIRPA
jgi:hypothetical protein